VHSVLKHMVHSVGSVFEVSVHRKSPESVSCWYQSADEAESSLQPSGVCCMKNTLRRESGVFLSVFIINVLVFV